MRVTEWIIETSRESGLLYPVRLCLIQAYMLFAVLRYESASLTRTMRLEYPKALEAAWQTLGGEAKVGGMAEIYERRECKTSEENARKVRDLKNFGFGLVTCGGRDRQSGKVTSVVLPQWEAYYQD